jgi:hypothetical protein
MKWKTGRPVLTLHQLRFAQHLPAGNRFLMFKL